MRTRNTDDTNSATTPAPAKRVKATRKTATRSTPSPSDSTATTKTAGAEPVKSGATTQSPDSKIEQLAVRETPTKTTPSRLDSPVTTKTAGAEQVKSGETATTTPSSDSKIEQSVAGASREDKPSSVVTPATKVTSGAKFFRRKIVARRTTIPKKALKLDEKERVVVVKAMGLENNDEPAVKVEGPGDGLEAANKDGSAVTNNGQSKQKEDPEAIDIEEDEEDPEEDEEWAAEAQISVMDESTPVEVKFPPSENLGDPAKQTELVVSEDAKATMDKKTSCSKGGEVTNEEPEKEMTENVDKEERQKIEPPNDEDGADEGLEEYGDRVDFGDHDEDDLADEEPEEIPEDTVTIDEENRELTAMANERRIKKAHEIFVGGLDREAREEDIKNVFEKIGEVVEVRLHKNFASNKNKGYAFVKFANKEHAKRALSELKNPVVCGKRCGTAPSEENDTLFLGNICNTWTKEAIRKKLKEYGVEGVESITLVSDVQHEGRSRGFAFLDFSCHTDAMHAYNRLQKPDAVFGHPERTAKVAFAEPLREADPEVMAQVKTVFLDGIPPHWDEDSVRELLKSHGEILRIVLARNMSTAKRKDFGFVDFTTHDAAVVCINSINNQELGDEKTKVKARLSNPLPKTQAVKGGMCGGFRIGQSGSGTFPRFGRGFGRAGQPFNRPSFQRGRGFYRGRGLAGRTGPHDYDFDNRHDEFHGRQFYGRGGRRDFFRGGQRGFNRGAAAGPSRSNFARPWHDEPYRGYDEHMPPRRQPFSPEEAYDRPFIPRHFEDPYFYDDPPHGMKRPFYMMDQDPDYMEPGRLRPRFDYSDPAGSFHGDRYRGSYEADRGFYSREDDYYARRDFGAYPPYYGSDRPYGGGYYY